MLVTKEEFVDWKTHPVTKEVFGTMRDRINELLEYLIEAAGSPKASEYSGAIKAYREILEINYEETQ